MIRIQHLTKRFGTHPVLDRISLSIRPGERVALVGLNGAGKTTLMRCLLGLTSFEGRLTVAGYDVRAQGREVRARLGYVPQRAPHLDGTLQETIAFFTQLRGADPETVAAQLQALGLSPDEQGAKPVRALSGGMLQKMLLGLALGSDVPLLLLDEPTANLDPRARREFLRVLRDVNGGTTIVLASHRLSDVEAIARRVVVLHDGRVAFDGPLTELRERFDEAASLWLDEEPLQALVEHELA